ncbi:tRNA (adenosine(37)-N6)-threonylcarbamoyltransferase complex ATPase subunit type 1 TsaE [Tessaracoccus aquimaris]|uniref:tRNA threonylcarbamoyladenosine biosynthesis protein TsaE n=1 Tax=Tessaracoccus aquimaris TaxID=1332264 RepID=A0A1Q2CNW3_9ACTN|nr:tRNA (adenosine(37)-N6)-threonylcarbamoyltransferase complex ATPase subunit type 1 TsaE [Tessaracoccus aquimaris]AQP47796.1 tRNA (adenosine(37)-N6)-threonylcarbamoyltransferase complex ATPase subunit type 1 TsaE [Tessaracoccus aquimaris]
MESAELTVRVATPADAAELLRVIREAFSARRPVDPPADALSDEVADIERDLVEGTGVVVEADGRMVAGVLLELDGDTVTLRRVSVVPEAAGHGVARDMIASALTVAADLGARRARLVARTEFPELIGWWTEHGFEVLEPAPHGVWMGRDLPVVLDVPTADDMRDLGRRLAGLLRAGDVIVATGDLGAGKTTLTQGIGEGLDVQGPVISPTFVISRVHPPKAAGPALVHVDAYRLGAASELADIDLDASLSDAVTLIEWGSGLAEWLADDRLEIDILRGQSSDERTVFLTGVGPRWAGALDDLRRQP